MTAPLLIAKNAQAELNLLPALANRHGLIAGATGTGKTVTLQKLAESFAHIGVPVFMADVKGDLAAMAAPGELTPRLQERLQMLGVADWDPARFTTVPWDVFGEKGHPLRATISDMGPLLLARLLNLNDTQAGVLQLVFKIADDQGLLLLDLKDLRAMVQNVGDNAKNYTTEYGNIAAASIGAIQRGLLTLEEQGGDFFFGEPMLNIADLMQIDANGRGVINVLAAEKLIYVVEQEGILDEHGTLISNLSAQEARELLDNQRAQPNQRRLLQSAVNAVEKQVQRTQILSGRQDGSLIRELFTRHGAGTSVARAAFMTIRQAQSSDISAITTLIRPLEDEGVLLRRSREYLENHIGEFSILEHDRQIYGCVALKTFEPSEAGELACLVVSPEAQDGGYGELLLEHLLANARARGIRRLFALSTHTGEWFIERGFQAAAVADLPEERQQEYHQSRRQSKVFAYSL